MMRAEFKPVEREAVESYPPGEGTTLPRPGDFILTHGTSWTSKLIRIGETIRIHGNDARYAWWNHAALIVGSDGAIVEALGAGVRRGNISRYTPAEYQLVRITASDEDRHEAVGLGEACVGQPYGWLTIASIAASLLTGTKFSFGFDGTQICSGLVASAMERTTAIFNRDASHIMPADLAKYYDASPPNTKEKGVPNRTSSSPTKGDESHPHSERHLSHIVVVLLAVIVAVGCLLAGTFVAIYHYHSPSAAWQLVWNLLGIAALLATVIAILPSARQEADSTSAFVCGLVASAALIPITVAEVVAVIMYIAPIRHLAQPHEWIWIHRLPLAVSGWGALIVWLAWAYCAGRRATPPFQNPRAYADLCERYMTISRAYESLPEAAWTQAQVEARDSIAGHLEYVKSEFGFDSERPLQPYLRWVLQSGYITLWNRLHRAEESLLMLQDEPTVLAAAKYDVLRLGGSAIPNSQALVKLIEDARQTLEGVGGQDGSEGKKMEARRDLVEVRWAIDQFRDDSWDGLIRQRNHLLEAVVFTRSAAFAFLALLLIVGVPVTAVASGAVLYLTGSIIGLFNRIQPRQSTPRPVEDYGLTSLTTVQTPMVSGLAAIAGVTLTTLLLDPVISSATNAHAFTHVPTLKRVFDLQHNPGALVIAAVFGLTPRLLIGRLQMASDKYKSDIMGTEAVQRQPSGAQ